MVPHRAGLAGTVDGDVQVGLLKAQHMHTLCDLGATADLDARLALENLVDVLWLQSVPIILGYRCATCGLNLLLTVVNHSLLLQMVFGRGLCPGLDKVSNKTAAGTLRRRWAGVSMAKRESKENNSYLMFCDAAARIGTKLCFWRQKL